MGFRVFWAFTAVISLLLTRYAYGDITVKPQCRASTSWMSNSKGQSPCVVYAYLSSVCDSERNWIVDRPGSSGTYDPPSPDDASPCQCNTVSYNLVQGCAWCQGAQIISWNSWITNCPPLNISTEYDDSDVPSETVIPPWARWDPRQADSWNPYKAREIAASTRRKLHLPFIIGMSAGGCLGTIVLILVVLYLYRRFRSPTASIRHQIRSHRSSYQPPDATVTEWGVTLREHVQTNYANENAH